MKFRVGDVFQGWRIVRSIYANDYRELYSVLDCNNKGKEYCLVILLKPEIDHSFNYKAFSNEDVIVNAIPEIRYRDFHGGPCVYADGTPETGFDCAFFVCESLDRNIMKYFSNEEGTLPSTVFLAHASRMFAILQKFKDRNKCLYSVGPYDFYESNSNTSSSRPPRIFLLNQSFSQKDSLKFNLKFASVSVMKGNEPTLVDNCISCCYILYFWRTGSLPWLETIDKDKEIEQKIAFNDTDSDSMTVELDYVHSLLKQFTRNDEDINFTKIRYEIKQLGGFILDESSIIESPTIERVSVSPKRTPTRYNLREAITSARERNELEKERTIALTMHMRKASKRTPLKRSYLELSQESVQEKDVIEGISSFEDKDIVFENAEQVDKLLDKEQAPENPSKRRRILNMVRSVVAPFIVGSAILIGKYIFEN